MACWNSGFLIGYVVGRKFYFNSSVKSMFIIIPMQ